MTTIEKPIDVCRHCKKNITDENKKIEALNSWGKPIMLCNDACFLKYNPFQDISDPQAFIALHKSVAEDSRCNNTFSSPTK